MKLFKSKKKPAALNVSISGDASCKSENTNEQTQSADIGYRRLEQRQVLSASFIAGAGGIILDSFDPNQDLLFGQASSNVNGAFQDAYIFVLDSGSWTGSVSDPLVELESVNGGTNNRLEVATSLFGGASNGLISVDGSTSGNDIEFDQIGSVVEFDTFTISNLTNVDRTFRLNSIGNVFASDIQVVDSNPNDNFVPNANLTIQTVGSINIQGSISNLTDNMFNDVVLTAVGTNNDINVGGIIETSDGSIVLTSDDDVLLNSNGQIISAGNDNAVSISAQGSILDNTISEAANITTTAGRVQLFASDGIGLAGAGDIDIESRYLEFNTSGQAIVTDLGTGLTIDRFSQADAGAQVQSSGFLAINSSINVGADSSFWSGGNNDLTINNGAVVSLNSSSLSQLDLSAGDDIVFDTGRVVTTGGSHTVVLTADLEGPGDNDRGSISNAAGSSISVTTSNLIATAFDGIGNSNNAPLRIDVDQLTAINSGTNDIRIVESNAIELVNVQTNNNFSLSADQIANSSSASINVGDHAQFNATTEVVLGNQSNDNINLAQIGIVAPNAHLELDSSTILNGNTPDQSTANFGLAGSRGTEVTQTLYLASTGSVTQNQGVLNVGQIGIKADEHVHLASISPNNDAVAISAGASSQLMQGSQLEQELQTLSAVENSEVDGNRSQSIAIKHQGQLNVTTVQSHLGFVQESGLQSTDGSIFASAEGILNLENDIAAATVNTGNANSEDSQVTVYSAQGSATNPGIQFAGGFISVLTSDNSGTVINEGIVNANQTSATFFDADDEVLSGTTEILLLATDGTAAQDIVVEYGNVGEEGYRVGIAWDRDNLLANGELVEDINTYVPQPTIESEAFEDTIFQNNTNTFLQIAGNEGSRETFSKVERYSSAAVINHQFSPNVFSEVTVRNDQDINLFTGALSATTNSLNETSQVLRAEFDSPRGFAPDLPTINRINPIEIKSEVFVPPSSTSPESSASLTFSREVQPFESGDLKWVQVQIPIEELEEIEGDVRLKDPTKVFPNAEDAEFNKVNDPNNLDGKAEAIGDNEVEKIIDAIETNKEAEAGYWYKVFKDYRNRDDELFFYHFKTGEPQQPDAGSPTDLGADAEESFQNDLGSSSTSINPNTELNLEASQQNFLQPPDQQDNQIQSDFPNEDVSPIEAEPSKTLFNPFTNPNEDTESKINLDTSEKANLSPHETVALRSLSAGSLLAAATLISQTKKTETTNKELENQEEAQANKFSRLDRLKRRIKQLLG